MNQKLFIGLISSFIVVIVLFLYFFFFKVSNNNPHAIDVVPGSACIIFETQNLESTVQSIISENFYKQINKSPNLNELTSDILEIDSVLNTDKNFNEWKQSKRSVISFHTDKGKNIHIFMAVEIEESPDVIETFKWLTNKYNNRYKITKRLYNKELIYDFTDFSSARNFSVAIYKGILMFAFDGMLVEDAIIKCKYYNSYTESELKNLNFVKSITSDFNIYINYKNIGKFFNCFTSESYNSTFSFLSDLANWSGGDIQVNANNILVSGASITDDSLFQFLDIFSEQIPAFQAITDKLPQTTNFYLLQNISNVVAYQKNLIEYMNSTKTISVFKRDLDSVEENLHIKFNEAFIPSLGNNYLLASLSANGLSMDSSWVGIFSPTNLNEFINSVKQLESKIKSSASDTIVDTVKTSSSKYNTLPIGNVLKYYCAGFEKLNIQYYSINNGLVIMASNTQLIQHFIEKMNENNTLQSLDSYKEIKLTLSPQSSVEMMVFNKNAINLVNSFASPSLISSVSINKGYFKKAEIFSAQFAAQGEKTFSTQLALQFNKSETNGNELIWESVLDTCIVSKPTIVNHTPSNEQVLLVQDALFNLYCINKDGKQLWKEKINSKIISHITQVDVFSNGSTQYLFNTNNQIFLLDGNGKNMQNYPIWIPAATNYPISVFDFQSDHSYKIFVSGKYYKLWQYDIKGMLQTGFNPKEIWPNSIQPIHGFTFGKDNFVYSLNEKGMLNIYRTDGKKYTDIHVDSLLSYKYVNHFQLDTGSIRLFCLDSTNTLHISDFYSTGITKPISEYLVKNNKQFKLLFNSRGEVENYVLKTNNTYEVYDNKMQVKFSYLQQDSIIDNSPEIIYLEGKPIYAFISPNNCELILNDIRGKAYNTFKYKGCRQFGFGNLFSDSDLYLVIGSDDNKLSVYRVK